MSNSEFQGLAIYGDWSFPHDGVFIGAYTGQPNYKKVVVSNDHKRVWRALKDAQVKAYIPGAHWESKPYVWIPKNAAADIIDWITLLYTPRYSRYARSKILGPTNYGSKTLKVTYKGTVHNIKCKLCCESCSCYSESGSADRIKRLIAATFDDITIMNQKWYINGTEHNFNNKWHKIWQYGGRMTLVKTTDEKQEEKYDQKEQKSELKEEEKKETFFTWELLVNEALLSATKKVNKRMVIRSPNLQQKGMLNDIHYLQKAVYKAMRMCKDLKPNKKTLSAVEYAQLFEKLEKMLLDKMYGRQILQHDLSLSFQPVCICGANLIPQSNKDCYVGTKFAYVICDLCDKPINSVQDVFHCPKKSEKHKDGYDICIKCSRANNNKLNRYHALIINAYNDPEPQFIHNKIKDGEELKKLFESINYHTVELLSGSDATEQNIKQKLEKLSTKDENDVILICYSGHGYYQSREFYFTLETENMKKIPSAKLMKWLNRTNDSTYGRDSAICGISCDVMMLINACHSGAFSHYSQSNNNNNNNANRRNRLGWSRAYDMKQRILEEHKNDSEAIQWAKAARSVTVISSCLKNQESNATPGGVSEFIKYAIKAFKNEYNNHSLVTPKTIYEDIAARSKLPINNEIPSLTLHTMGATGQTTNKSFETGLYASIVSLNPIVKPY